MEIKKDQSFGVVPVFKSPTGFLYCVVLHRAGHWGFPKGHQHEGEATEATALRELKEEVGVDSVSLIPNAEFVERYTFLHAGVSYDKTVTYYLGVVSKINSLPSAGFESEIAAIEWLPYAEARARLTYESNRPTIDQAEALLTL